MELQNITITDNTIIQYYNDNPHIDITTMNLIFIDILKNLSTNLSETVHSTINNKLLNSVNELNSMMITLKPDILLKMQDIKKDYIDDIKNALLSNHHLNQEKMDNTLDRNNDLLLSKTTLLLNDILPKNNETGYLQVEKCIKSFSENILQDTTKIINHNATLEPFKTDNIIDNIENQLNKMVSNIQQPIFSFIQSSEERTNTGIKQMNDELNNHHSSNNGLTTELNAFLNKYKNNSSTKGSVSEIELYYMLQSLMPSDEIIKVTSSTATCDFKVNRLDKSKPILLFESKDYTISVPTDEVKKFERDIQIQKNHGIMVSQKSPITFKDCFQIDIINNLIHVYIPNANYDIDKIKIAINIIDHLAHKLTAINNKPQNSNHSLDNELLSSIVEEYTTFGNQKLQLIETTRIMTKTLTDKIDELQLPSLKKYLIELGSIESDKTFKCTFCNNYSGKSKAGLGAHLRNCKLIPKNNLQI